MHQTQSVVAEALEALQSVISRLFNRFMKTGNIIRRIGHIRTCEITQNVHRNLTLITRRNRRMKANLFQQHFKRDIGTRIFTQSDLNRLHHGSLYAYRPMFSVSLTAGYNDAHKSGYKCISDGDMINSATCVSRMNSTSVYNFKIGWLRSVEHVAFWKIVHLYSREPI